MNLQTFGFKLAVEKLGLSLSRSGKIPIQWEQQENDIMQIDLTRTTLPEDGFHVGTFVDISTKTVQGKKGEVGILTLTVELKPKGDTKFKHRAHRNYRLDSKGINSLKADVEHWRGKPLSMEEMATFDADVEFNGKNVEVEISRSIEDKKPVAKFGPKFKAISETTSSSEKKETAK